MEMTRSQIVISVIAVAVLVLAGCAGSRASLASGGAPGTVSEASVAVPRLLDFTAKTLDGSDFSGNSLVGKAAVLWFWAPWCPVCQKEAPELQDATNKHADVTFVGVASQGQVPAMRDFVTKQGLRFTQLADTDGKIWARYGITHQPAFAFFGPNGRAEVVKEPLSGTDLDNKITRLAS